MSSINLSISFYLFMLNVTSAVVSPLNFYRDLLKFCIFLWNIKLNWCIKWLKLWIFAIKFSLFFFVLLQCLCVNVYAMLFVLFRLKELKKKCDSGNVVLVFAGKCAIYGSQMVPGFTVELQRLVFCFFFLCVCVFLFSSQLLRSLNAFWSWGWPGNLRTYTNAP